MFVNFGTKNFLFFVDSKGKLAQRSPVELKNEYVKDV